MEILTNLSPKELKEYLDYILQLCKDTANRIKRTPNKLKPNEYRINDRYIGVIAPDKIWEIFNEQKRKEIGQCLTKKV